nr:MAG TPA: hypothetical protein [Bacteriophage sp.]
MRLICIKLYSLIVLNKVVKKLHIYSAISSLLIWLL